MISANLQQWIRHPEMLNKDTLYELRTMLTRYPYFQSLRLIYLKNLYLLHDITFGAELRKAALYVADRRSLFYLIEGDRYVLSRKKKTAVPELPETEPNLDRTLMLIDAFLSTAPEDLSSQTTLDYSMDYTSYLIQEEDDCADAPSESPKLKGFELIDDFIEKSESEPALKRKSLSEEHPGPEEVADDSLSAQSQPEEGEDEEDESYFTETLAKIYVKQQRYSKALEIIKKLSLKYPKKNAYFADQIRFLEKLIINAKSK